MDAPTEENTAGALTAPATEENKAEETNANPINLGTLQVANIKSLVANAAEIATELSKIIIARELSIMIQNKHYIKIDGWTTLAIMLGCVAREVQTTEENGVYVSTVELVRITDGFTVSRASAECGEEKPWNTRPRYARRSMAQTRATSKACRLAFSWIVVLAGYETTTAEEMPPQTHETLAEEPQNVRVLAVQKDENDKISEKQYKVLEMAIYNANLSLSWVIEKIKNAWGISDLMQINQKQFVILINRINQQSPTH